MPAFKKRMYRRRPKRGYRRPGGRFRRGAPSRGLYHAPHHFTETLKLADLVSKASTGADTGYNFALQGKNIINLYASLNDVFRQFTILGVKLMYIPAYNNYPLVAGTAIIPHIYFAEDKATSPPDTPTGPVAVASMLQQDNLRILDASKRWSAYISRPKADLEMWNSDPLAASHTQVQPPSKAIQWLTTRADDMTYSGLSVNWLNSLCVVEKNNSAVDITTGTVWAKVYYACKEQQ